MTRLKKMLSEKQKKLRSRNNTLNLQITVLGWMVEIFGFFSTILGVYILGHGNSIVTITLHTITMINYYIILPGAILINSEDAKEYILDHESYYKLLRWFGCEPSHKDKPKDKEIQIEAAPNVENPPSPPNSVPGGNQRSQNDTNESSDHQIDTISTHARSEGNDDLVGEEETKRAWLSNSNPTNEKNYKMLRQRKMKIQKNQNEHHTDDDSSVREEIEQKGTSQDMDVEDLDGSHVV